MSLIVEKVLKKRMVITICLFSLAVILLLSRMYYVMVVSNEHYKVAAKRQYESISKLPASRGEIRITDRYSDNYFPVAVSVKKYIAYANPKRIVDLNLFIEKVSGSLLDVVDEEMMVKLKDKSKGYVVLKRRLSEEERQKLLEKKISGLEFDVEYVRVYPHETFLSHVLGFVGYKGDDKVGLYGLEKEYEDVLRGKDGVKVSNDGGLLASHNLDSDAVNGASMLLTIDKTIQYNAEKIIKEAVVDNSADSGSIVVLEPKTGRLLASAVYPDFNPEEYGAVEDLGVFNNQVAVGDYEPGSVFKPLTMAMGLEEKTIRPDTKYFDKGSVQIDTFEIKNSDKLSHGYQTMSQVLEKSLNTGMIFVKDSIGNEKFLSYVKKFGFGTTTGVDLPESFGSIKNITGNIKVNFHTASFGQGITVTPLQLARAFCAIANRGFLPKPYIVSSVISSDGQVREISPAASVSVVSPEVASAVTEMMVSVVDKGHGKKAGVAGYRVAGKTGTAQVAKKNNNGYEENVNIGSFVGFAPADSPRFVAVVRVNHPKNVKYAESTAAPAFGKLAKFILDYYSVR